MKNFDIKKRDWLLIFSFLVLIILLFVYTTMDNYSYALLDEENLWDGYYLNPDWIEYIESSEEEKAKYDLIPERYLFDYKASEKTPISFFELLDEAEEELPSYYNLKDEGDGNGA